MIRQKIQEWLPTVWKTDKRGLLTQRLAACLIGISDQSVKRAAERGHIEYHECENVRLYSYSDVLLYKETREAMLEKAKAFEAEEKLKKENPKKWEEFKEQQHYEEERLRYEAEEAERLKDLEIDYYENSDQGRYEAMIEEEMEEAHQRKKQKALNQHLIRELKLIPTLDDKLRPKTKEAEQELKKHLKKFDMTEEEFYHMFNLYF